VQSAFVHVRKSAFVHVQVGGWFPPQQGLVLGGAWSLCDWSWAASGGLAASRHKLSGQLRRLQTSERDGASRREMQQPQKRRRLVPHGGRRRSQGDASSRKSGGGACQSRGGASRREMQQPPKRRRRVPRTGGASRRETQQPQKRRRRAPGRGGASRREMEQLQSGRRRVPRRGGASRREMQQPQKQRRRVPRRGGAGRREMQQPQQAEADRVAKKRAVLPVLGDAGPEAAHASDVRASVASRTAAVCGAEGTWEVADGIGGQTLRPPCFGALDDSASLQMILEMHSSLEDVVFQTCCVCWRAWYSCPVGNCPRPSMVIPVGFMLVTVPSCVSGAMRHRKHLRGPGTSLWSIFNTCPSSARAAQRAGRSVQGRCVMPAEAPGAFGR
jgi:hypothetical protein